MHRSFVFLAIAFLVALPGAGLAQQEAAPAAAPAADPADVESIDAILAALYDVISGPAGGRDWYLVAAVVGLVIAPLLAVVILAGFGWLG